MLNGIKIFYSLSAGLLIAVIITAGPPSCREIPKEAAPLNTLKIVGKSATTTLKQGGNFQIENLTDGGSGSWCEGEPGDGLGAELMLKIEPIMVADENTNIEIRRLEVRNGLGDTRFYARNNRVKQLEAAIGDEKFLLNLKDTNEPQSLEFPKPVRLPAGGGVYAIGK